MSKKPENRDDLIKCAKAHIMAVVVTMGCMMSEREKGLSESDRIKEVMAVAESVNYVAGHSAGELVGRFEDYFKTAAPTPESGLAAMAGFTVPPTSGAVLQETIDKRLLEAENRIHEIVSKELIDARHAVERAVYEQLYPESRGKMPHRFASEEAAQRFYKTGEGTECE